MLPNSKACRVLRCSNHPWITCSLLFVDWSSSPFFSKLVIHVFLFCRHRAAAARFLSRNFFLLSSPSSSLLNLLLQIEFFFFKRKFITCHIQLLLVKQRRKFVLEPYMTYMLTVESAAPGEGNSDLMLSIDWGDNSPTLQLERWGIPGAWASGEICRVVGGWLTPGDILIVVYPGEICVEGACLETGEGIDCDCSAAFNLCKINTQSQKNDDLQLQIHVKYQNDTNY